MKHLIRGEIFQSLLLNLFFWFCRLFCLNLSAFGFSFQVISIRLLLPPYHEYISSLRLKSKAIGIKT